MDYTFGNPFLAGHFRWAGRLCAFKPVVVHSDCLSAEHGHVRNFVLTNIRNAVRTPERGGDSKVVGMQTNMSDEDHVKPFWSLTAYSCKAKWDPKEEEWDDGGKWWQKDQSMEVAFREAFRVFGKGDDYYFLTDSGSVYWSPPPAKKEAIRPVTRVYDGGKRRVVAVITDADAKRTFLFLDTERGGKPTFFELAEKPKLVEYDPEAVPMPAAGEPSRTLLHQARILVALKQIKLADKKKP